MNTGNRAVDEISKMNFSGNVIPQNWFRHIIFDNGKPDTVAIILLSDIVYWYRHTEVRDEISGQVVCYKKKFKADKLQKSYSAMADQYGFTKRQVQDAMNRLKNKGIITIELRTIATANTKLGNVVFVEPVAEVINRITHPITPASDPSHVVTGEAITVERETNTEITYTENTTNINNHNGATSRSARTTLKNDSVDSVDNEPINRESLDTTKRLTAYYLASYKHFLGIEHPKLKRRQWDRVTQTIMDFSDEHGTDLGDMGNMVKRHFERSMETDYNINHFATEGVLTNLFYEAAY